MPTKSKKQEGIHHRNILSAPHTNIQTPPKGKADYDPKKGAANLRALANFGPKSKEEPTKFKKQEGIHDHPMHGRMTDNPQTNIQTPPKGSKADYNPATAAANLRALANFGPKSKEEPKKENMDGAIDSVYAVQKPYSGCQLTSLVHPIDPLKGLEGSEVMPDQIHGVYNDQEQAQAAAQGLYEEYTEHRKNLEEKKGKVVEKIKKVMNKLEKERKHHTDMIKENPKDSSQSKQKVAELTHKLDELINTLERVEISKQPLEEENPEETKEKLKEALSTVFEKKYHEFTYEPVQGKEKQKVLAKNLASAKKKAYEKGGDPKTVKAEEEPKEELK